MREKPILFKGEMVRAILEGRKTQTRRIKAPWEVGDRLWVRETFCHKIDSITAKVSETEFWYRATTPDVMKVDGDGAIELAKGGYEASPWKPSILMPRSASRITLEVIGKRQERLQEIKNEDAKAEGVIPMTCCLPGAAHYIRPFRDIWDSINGKKPNCSWDYNPLVWVTEFKVVKP